MAVDYTKLLDGNSLKAIRTYLSTNYQPLHANLTSIAALSTSTTGLIKMTNGVASFDTTTYAPAASPTFTGTVTLPTTVKIGTSTATGLVKYTNGVLSIDTTSYVKANNAIAGATKCKITYDAKGLVTSGADLAASDIPDLSATYVTLTGNQNITGVKTFINQIKFKASANSTNEQLTISLVELENSEGCSKLVFDGCSYLEFKNMQLSLFSLSLNTLRGIYQTIGSSYVECLYLGDSEGMGLNLISQFNSDGAISFRTLNSDSGLTPYKLKVPSTVGYTEDRTIATTKDLEAYVPLTQIGAANGIASLDSTGKVPTSQLPDSIVGQMEYKGTWAADTGLTITPQKGWYYICSKAGTKNPDKSAGPASGYDIGDWAVYNGSSWDKIDNSDDLSGTVRYDIAQSLNATQKAQALSNIGAQSSLVGTQTAYTTKGSAYKVPQISTNNLGQVTLITEVDIAAASIVNTVGSESITVATSASSSKTLNVVTRDTHQTITAYKTFQRNIEMLEYNDSEAGLVNPIIYWSFTTTQSGSSTCLSLSGSAEMLSNHQYCYLRIYGSSGGGDERAGLSFNGIDYILSQHNAGEFESGIRYFMIPDKSVGIYTLATTADISAAVGNVYTEQEALAILNGTAS